MSPGLRHRLAAGAAAAMLALAAGLARGQAPGCDEGVIRLPDRSGTIQICSAMAARVPELARQLTQATAALGSQQAQVAELTRLVRGLNNVSRSIGTQRQTEMLQSLSARLDAAQRERDPEVIARLNDRLDGLQASLMGALTDPKMASALGDAIKGPLGEAIARLDLGSASRQIDDISTRLKALQSEVAEVRGDTTAIRQHLAQLDQRQHSAEGERRQREEVTVDLLRRMAREVRDLGQRDGLIAAPSGYAAHYHNARILAQRGETDLALASYRQVFRTGVQMADPIVDLTTLLVRQYGRQGALQALARDFQQQLPEMSYLFARQVLAERELDEVEAFLFKDPDRLRDFPPLATLYLRRVHERLGRQRTPIGVYTFAWSDMAGIGAISQRVQREVETGNYLAYFIDQIRGARDLDEFRAIADAFSNDKILKVTVPNLSGSERLRRQSVALSRSPVVLDYTYFFEAPAGDVISDLTRNAAFAPKHASGSVFLFIWDAAVDTEKPIRVCGGGSGDPKCVDINARSMRCTSRSGERAINCLMTRFIGSDRGAPPFIEAHFVAPDLLGHRCISRVSYTTRSGREVSIGASQLIGAYRRAVDREVGDVLAACGYDPQAVAAAEGAAPSASQRVAPPAQERRDDPAVAYNRANCARVGYRGYMVYGSRTLAAHRMDAYLVKLAHAMKTYPLLPTAQDGDFSGRFDDADQKCKLHLVINGAPHACTVARIVTNRWLPPDGAPRRGEMTSPARMWNAGVYPDSSAPIDSVQQENRTADDPRKAPAKGRLADARELLEATGVEHELEAFGAGHSQGCDTIGYTGIRFRISVDLGLRALEGRVCNTGDSLRRQRLEAGQQASARQFNGCFTAQGMREYSQRAAQWLADAAKDCSGPAGRQVQAFIKEAAAWAIEQP